MIYGGLSFARYTHAFCKFTATSHKLESNAKSHYCKNLWPENFCDFETSGKHLTCCFFFYF